MNGLLSTFTLTKTVLFFKGCFLNRVAVYTRFVFTPVYNRFSKVLFSVGLLAFSSLFNLSTANSAIHFAYLKEVIQEPQLSLNSAVEFHLPQPIISALHHEIHLHFKTEILLREKQEVLGVDIERTRQSIAYHTELYAYGVNRHYVLHNHRNQKIQTFQTLEAALQTLGTMQALPIIKLSELHPEQQYVLHIRLSLDKWKLPAPLLLDALFEDYWQLDSGWFEIEIQTPKSWI